MRPYDLHALSTPPAFVLDQDQILNWIPNLQGEAEVNLLNPIEPRRSSDEIGAKAGNHKVVRLRPAESETTARRSNFQRLTSFVGKFGENKRKKGASHSGSLLDLPEDVRLRPPLADFGGCSNLQLRFAQANLAEEWCGGGSL